MAEGSSKVEGLEDAGLLEMLFKIPCILSFERDKVARATVASISILAVAWDYMILLWVLP